MSAKWIQCAASLRRHSQPTGEKSSRGWGNIITAAPYSPPLGPPQSRSRYFLATEAVQNGVSPPFVLRRVSVHCRALLLDCVDNTLIVSLALAPKRSCVQIFLSVDNPKIILPTGAVLEKWILSAERV